MHLGPTRPVPLPRIGKVAAVRETRSSPVQDHTLTQRIVSRCVVRASWRASRNRLPLPRNAIPRPSIAKEPSGCLPSEEHHARTHRVKRHRVVLPRRGPLHRRRLPPIAAIPQPRLVELPLLESAVPAEQHRFAPSSVENQGLTARRPANWTTHLPPIKPVPFPRGSPQGSSIAVKHRTTALDVVDRRRGVSDRHVRGVRPLQPLRAIPLPSVGKPVIPSEHGDPPCLCAKRHSVNRPRGRRHPDFSPGPSHPVPLPRVGRRTGTDRKTTKHDHPLPVWVIGHAIVGQHRWADCRSDVDPGDAVPDPGLRRTSGPPEGPSLHEPRRRPCPYFHGAEVSPPAQR